MSHVVRANAGGRAAVAGTMRSEIEKATTDSQINNGVGERSQDASRRRHGRRVAKIGRKAGMPLTSDDGVSAAGSGPFGCGPTLCVCQALLSISSATVGEGSGVGVKLGELAGWNRSTQPVCAEDARQSAALLRTFVGLY